MSGSVFDVKDFGAIGDGQADDTAAFQRALAAIEALSPVTDVNGTFSDTRGTILFVPFGQYALSSTLRIRRQMIIQGVSGAGDFSGTQLIFARDIDGIVIERQDIPNVSRFGAQFGDWTVIRDIAVQSDAGFAFSQAPNPSVNEDEPVSASRAHIDHEPLHGHGVVLNSRARLVNCQIAGFHYDGVHIDTVDDFKNANNFEIHNCRIIQNGRHGIFPCGGQNSNAGRVFGVDCSGNAGWGVYDRSFLGNTYVGCHCADNGHFAQDMRCLLVDPNTPAVTYAGTADGGLYRATDGGRNWSACNRGLGVGGFNAQLSALALDPAGAPLYAGTLDGGVLRLDMAPLAQWTPINNGLTNTTVRALVITGSPPILYAGTAGGVFKSTDGGQAWGPVNAGLTDTDVAALAVDPATPATIYAGTAGGVFKSTDGGQSWNISLPGQRVAAVAIDPATSTIVYAGTAAGVFKSSDGGLSWTATNSGLAITLDVRAVAVDPQTPTTVYVGTHPAPGFDASKNLGGVYRSLDGGATWHGGLPAGDPETAARTFYGGGYKTTSPIAANVLLGCYSEADQVNGNELSHPTLVLGGQLGGGFNPVTTAGIINEAGITNLPLRSPVVHNVQTFVRKVSVPPIVPTSLEQHNIFPGDEVTFVDLSNGNMTLTLSPANLASGQQFTIKRIDSAPNPPPFEAWISVGTGEAIDTGTRIRLTQPNTAVTLLANGTVNNYQIISTLGTITLE
jgi:photosystem II stability/assembly factor-like uncharacterized protein